MNKTQQKITNALVDQKNCIVYGTNMATNIYGTRYKVDNGKLYYWGSLVAKINYKKKSITIDTCNYHTKTTINIINCALRAYEELTLNSHYVYQSKYQLMLSGSDWNGSRTTLK